MTDDVMPKTVKFRSQNANCVAFEVFGTYGLNMKSCQINFGEARPTVEVQPIEDFWRVRLNDGQVWFDTDAESAGAIAELFGA